MNKALSQVFFYSKLLLLLIAFSITLYILLIRMDISELSAWSIFPLFVPLFLLLIVFVFGLFLNIGRDNTFFNMVCVLVLTAIVVIDFRTIFDTNIISQEKIHLDFFNMYVNKIEIMLYLTLISNILLIIYDKKEKMHS